MLSEHVLLFSHLSQLCILMAFHCPMFRQTVFVGLATERFSCGKHDARRKCLIVLPGLYQMKKLANQGEKLNTYLDARGQCHLFLKKRKKQSLSGGAVKEMGAEAIAQTFS